MKIEIDTKHDSPAEIKKVISMLQQIVGENTYTHSKNIFEDPNSFGTSSSEITPEEPSTNTGSNAFVNMFGDTPTVSDPKEEPMSQKSEISEGLGTKFQSDEPTEEPQEEKEEVPEVIPY